MRTGRSNFIVTGNAASEHRSIVKCVHRAECIRPRAEECDSPCLRPLPLASRTITRHGLLSPGCPVACVGGCQRCRRFRRRPAADNRVARDRCLTREHDAHHPAGTAALQRSRRYSRASSRCRGGCRPRGPCARHPLEAPRCQLASPLAFLWPADARQFCLTASRSCSRLELRRAMSDGRSSRSGYRCLRASARASPSSNIWLYDVNAHAGSTAHAGGSACSGPSRTGVCMECWRNPSSETPLKG